MVRPFCPENKPATSNIDQCQATWQTKIIKLVYYIIAAIPILHAHLKKELKYLKAKLEIEHPIGKEWSM